jgi:hypothetical protein
MTLAEAWVACIAALCVTWGCNAWIGAAFGGKGIGIEGGEFVLRHGQNALQVSGAFCWFLFSLDSAMWLLFLASLILGVLVRSRYGTVRVDILHEQSTVRRFVVVLLTYCGGFAALSLVGHLIIIVLY